MFSCALKRAHEWLVCNRQIISRCHVLVEEYHLSFSEGFRGKVLRGSGMSQCRNSRLHFAMDAGSSWHILAVVCRQDKGHSGTSEDFLSSCENGSGHHVEFINLHVTQFCPLCVHAYVHILSRCAFPGTQHMLFK